MIAGHPSVLRWRAGALVSEAISANLVRQRTDAAMVSNVRNNAYA